MAPAGSARCSAGPKLSPTIAPNVCTGARFSSPGSDPLPGFFCFLPIAAPHSVKAKRLKERKGSAACPRPREKKKSRHRHRIKTFEAVPRPRVLAFTVFPLPESPALEAQRPVQRCPAATRHKPRRCRAQPLPPCSNVELPENEKKKRGKTVEKKRENKNNY